ncbi:ASCH domain-containing protein [Qipengyuania sp.]|uniref:ASCH domain-containing protein n=1 Tax=Qipengyuania sp. TaxID=2004515 RepID=UPI0035C7CA63
MDEVARQSVAAMWARFRESCPDLPETPPLAFHFCDNRDDADECANLVVIGQKQATAASLKELEIAGQEVARPGDYFVITDYDGTARAVIRTTSVEITRLGDIDAAFAWDEGEGDRTLEWWQSVHRAYYSRVLAGTGVAVDDDLLIACERFETVFTG